MSYRNEKPEDYRIRMCIQSIDVLKESLHTFELEKACVLLRENIDWSKLSEEEIQNITHLIEYMDHLQNLDCHLTK